MSYADWFTVVVILLLIVMAYTMICKGWSLWVAGFTGDTKEELEQYDGKTVGLFTYPLIFLIGVALIFIAYLEMLAFAICMVLVFVYLIPMTIYVEKDKRRHIRKK